MIKNKKIYLILILLLFLLCFISCKKDNNTDNKNNKKQESEYLKTCYQKMLDIPIDKTINDCSDNENIYIAIGKTFNTKYYSIDTKGSIKGEKWFITYTQSIDNQRLYNENQYFSYGSSIGTFKKMVFHKIVNENDYYWQEGKKNGDKVKWDEIHYETEKDFCDYYGQGPFGVSNYVINDYTIKEVIKEITGEDYIYKITLDPNESTKYYKQEIKYTSGISDYPLFNSVYMEIKMDVNWVIKTVHYYEEYEINYLGGIVVKSDITEYYTYSDKYIETERLNEFKKLINLE